jgi:hypothetical protein
MIKITKRDLKIKKRKVKKDTGEVQTCNLQAEGPVP